MNKKVCTSVQAFFCKRQTTGGFAAPFLPVRRSGDTIAQKDISLPQNDVLHTQLSLYNASSLVLLLSQY